MTSAHDIIMLIAMAFCANLLMAIAEYIFGDKNK